MDNIKRLQRLAGILKESVEMSEEKGSKFTVIEFENDLEVNNDNEELFNELKDPEENELEK